MKNLIVFTAISLIIIAAVAIYLFLSRTDQPPNNYPPTRTGNLSKLDPNDQIFIKFVDNLNYNYGIMDHYKYVNTGTAPATALSLNLTKINYEEVLYPLSSGAITVTFWKNAEGKYFFARYGGDPAASYALFGPFVINNGKVDFVK